MTAVTVALGTAEIRSELELVVGSQIDRYLVEGRLGVGGTAVVYLVRHAHLGTRYALKVLRSPHPEIRKRLLREGRVQSRLKHPNVVGVLDTVDVDGSPGLVMEYISGPSLGAFLSALRPTWGQIDALARDTLAGVAAAHDLGLIHRDLKPTNVLLEPLAGRLVARVADFGMAKLLEGEADGDSGLTRTGVVLGTPSYMSPEQANDASHVDERADVWALGAILYELVTGQRLLPPGRAFQILRGGVVEFPSPRALAPEIPDRWEAAIQAALTTDPAARPPNAGALLAMWGKLPGTVAWDAEYMSAPPDSAELRTLPPEPAGETYNTHLWEPTTAPVIHNLPPESDAFVGRAEQLTDIADAIRAGGRLITLIGAAGSGKSRLARRFAWDDQHAWASICFVDLSEATTPEGACFAVGRALKVPVGGADPVERVGELIRSLGGDRREAERSGVLVILDNFEQLAPVARETLGRWVERAQDAVFLVTSRARLRLDAERLLDVEPLPEKAAIDLFVTRARRAQPRFALTPTNAGAVKELVRLLEGLPLAIELAAARARVLTCEQMVERMNRRFRLLAASPRSGEHSTALRAALDGSWELLDRWEQSALAQLSCFEGGFQLEAAEAVLALEETDEALDEPPWILDVLESLVDKSLVRSLDGEPPRFSMFLSVQEYARERLTGADPVYLRHAAWYARMGSVAALKALEREGGGDRRLALVAELGNLIAASRRGGRDDRSEAGLAAGHLMLLQGPITGAMEIATGLLGEPAVSTRARALLNRALLFCGDDAALESSLSEATGRSSLRLKGAWFQKRGDLDAAREAFEEAAALAGSDPEEVCAALISLGSIHYTQTRPDSAREVLDRALVLSRSAGNQRLEAEALSGLGNLETSAGSYEVAQTCYEASLELFRALGDRNNEAVTQGRLGYLGLYQGDGPSARRWISRSLEANRRLGNRANEGVALCNLGSTWILEGDFQRASALFEEAVAVSREAGKQVSEVIALQSLGNAKLLLGDLDSAWEAFSVVLESAQESGDDWILASVLMDLAMVELARGELDLAEARLREVVVRAKALKNARRIASGLRGLAGVARARGEREEALVMLEEALVVDGGVGAESKAGRLAAIAALQAELGRSEQASATMAEAVGLCPMPEGPLDRIEWLLCQGRASLALGDLREARQAMESAWLLIERLGAGPRSGFMRQVTELRDAVGLKEREAATPTPSPPPQ